FARGAVRPAVACALVVVAAALAGVLAATAEGMLTRPAGVALTALTLAAGGVVWLRGPVLTPRAAWHGCAALTFAVLLPAVHALLPGHARRFSLRGPVRPYAEKQVPVACYPQPRDAVSFYLRDADVRVYRAEESADLLAALDRQPETLLVLTGAHAGDA